MKGVKEDLEAILVKSVAMLLMSAKKKSAFFLFARYWIYSILTSN